MGENADSTKKNKKSNNPVGPYFKFYAKCGVGYSDFHQKM